MPKRQTKKKKKAHSLEGKYATLTVPSFLRDKNLVLPHKAIKYLGVKPGDKLQILTRKGSIEISPILSPEKEIELYLSH